MPPITLWEQGSSNGVGCEAADYGRSTNQIIELIFKEHKQFIMDDWKIEI